MIEFYKKLFRKLFFVKTQTDFPGGYISNRFFLEQIDFGPILVIGDYTGRDYPAIKEKISETYLLDVVDNKIVNKKFFIQQSITEKTDFPDGYFRYIIMAEVIEHLWEDKKALEEVNRILSADGRLLLSVPFFNDVPEHHYHIYSPRTISILLKHSGFSIVQFNYRGLVTSIPNELVAFLAILLMPVYKRRALSIVNKFLYGIHKNVNNCKRLNQFFGSYGVAIIAKKGHPKIDPIEVQRKSFAYLREGEK